MVSHILNGRQSMTYSKIRGFTYLGLLFILVLIGITIAMAGTLWSFAQKREMERQLLFAGTQFKRAIGLYYQHTPGIIKRYPITLEELLQDNRFVTTDRYLRRIYQDPISGTNEWGLVRAPDGGVMGVYSLSKEKPVKTTFLATVTNLPVDIKTYADWQFIYVPPLASQTLPK